MFIHARKMYAISLLLFIFCLSLMHASTDLFHIRNLRGNIDISALYLMWNPALQSETQDVNFIESKTLGETTLNIKGHVEYSGYSILKIDYVIPLINTPDMKNIIDYNSRKEKGIENLQFYFIIDPIMNNLLSGDKWKYLRFFTNLKYNYQRRRYITNAVNNEVFFYISETATYNSSTGSIDNAEYIQTNTNMTWNTEIIEHEITLKILETDYNKVITGLFNNKIVPVQLRLGYFSIYQKQPASGIYTYSGTPTVMDAHLKANGIIVQIVTINEDQNGINIDLYAKMFSTLFNGSSIKSAAYDLYKDQFNSDAWPAYLSLGLNSWYNYELNHKCSITFGIKAEVNAFFIHAPNDADSSSKEEDSSKMIWRLRQWPTDFYLRFGYRF